MIFPVLNLFVLPPEAKRHILIDSLESLGVLFNLRSILDTKSETAINFIISFMRKHRLHF